MKLISEEKRDSKLQLINVIDWDGFIYGVSFAETELQNLAIEFALYYYLEKKFDENVEVRTEFSKFIEQRNK